MIKENIKEDLKLYSIQTNDKSALGKRKRDSTIELYPFEKKAVYRVTSYDESIQQSAFVFYDNNNKLSYLPIQNRLILNRKKEMVKKTKMFVPGLGDLNDQDDDFDSEYLEKVKTFGFPQGTFSVNNLPETSKEEESIGEILKKKASATTPKHDLDEDNSDDLFGVEDSPQPQVRFC